MGCFDNSLERDSDNYETKEKRVAVLKSEIKVFSDFEDAEFELMNANGFSDSWILLAGASYLDYKFAIKVKPSDVDKWTTTMTARRQPDYDNTWTQKIIEKHSARWKTTSEPQLFLTEWTNGYSASMLIYREEGIIFKHMRQE